MSDNRYLDELDQLETVDRDVRLKKIESLLKNKEEAAQTIPMLYLKDVVDIARLYEGQGVYAEDLIGEGNLALLGAARSLDLCDSAEEAEEFITRTVMDAMERLISEQADAENADEKILNSVNNVYEAAKEMAEALLRKVTVEELAKEMEVSEETIYEAIRLSGDHIEYIEVSNED